MGLFNVNAPLFADLNLLLQIIIFVMLFGGVIAARFRRDFRRHGAVMGLAVLLNTLSIAVVMIPSLLSFRGLLSAPLSPLAIAVIFHAAAGISVEILGIWVVVVWLMNRLSTRACSGKKSIMRTIISFWLIELILGIYVYIMLYVPT
jgi:uncharacterized membrane protein YozB (DUF420 family)